MLLHKHLILSVFIFILSGCAGLQSRAPQAPAVVPATAAPAAASQPVPDETQVTAETESLTGPLLFDILLGELAGHREQLDVSVHHYLQAAEVSHDPRVAERAMRIALFAKDETSALEAARRWVELDPERLDARQSVAALALRAGIRDEAQVHLRYLVERSEDSEQVFNTVTAMLAREEDRQAALVSMQELVADMADSAAAQFALSRIAAHASDFNLALESVEQALALKPDWVPALVHRARVRIKLNQADHAAEELAQAIRNNPDDTELRMVYAGLLLELRQVEPAKVQFGKLIELDPTNENAIYSLGLLAVDAGEFEAARDYFRRLLAMGKRDQEAYYYMGRMAEDEGDSVAAINWYSRLKNGQYLLDAQMRMAQLAAAQGDIDQARRQLQSLRLANPDLAVRLYLFEADLLIKNDNRAAAMDLYNKALTESPEQRDILYARGLLFEKLDDIAAAEADFRAILSQQPDHADTLNALGYTLADRTDRYAEALALIERAHQLKPNEAAIIDSLGWTHYRLGNFDKAIEYLQQAFELMRDSEVAAHLGEVLWQAGRRDEARKVWQEGQEINPDNPVLIRALERFNP